MERGEFLEQSKQIYQRIFDAFDQIDPDEAEADYKGDNVAITFSDRTTFVINRQAPLSQIWLATKDKGYHFDFDADKGQWLCNKTGKELFHLLEEAVSARLGKPFKID